MTGLQLVNAVLTRLREGTVSATTDTDYATLILALVNEAKREVEDAWNWSKLRDTIQITCVSGTYAYTLTGAGDRSRILTRADTGGADVFNDTQDYMLDWAGSSGLMSANLNNNSPQSGIPVMFDINGQSGGDPVVNLWPIPNSADVINFNMVIPQDDLADATELTVPDYPVLLGAYALAVNERGEDGGMSYAVADSKFRQALADAISNDAALTPEELEWH